MTKQELRENIAQLLAEEDGWNWAELKESDNRLFRGAPSKQEFYSKANKIIALIEKAGCVKLDKDQSLPKELVSCGFSCEKLLKDWRKVEIE